MHKAPSVSETCLLTNAHIYKWHADAHTHTHAHMHMMRTRTTRFKLFL